MSVAFLAFKDFGFDIDRFGIVSRTLATPNLKVMLEIMQRRFDDIDKLEGSESNV